MHSWADVEHKLSYKKKEHVPHQFRRKLYRLSALFEIADEEFDSLRKEREKYRKGLLSEKNIEQGHFDLSQELNIDSLQAFLDFYFPDRKKNINRTARLLDEIVAYNKSKKENISLKIIYETYEKFKDILLAEDMEILKQIHEEEFELIGEEKFEKKFKDIKGWTQIGIVRATLKRRYADYRAYYK